MIGPGQNGKSIEELAAEVAADPVERARLESIGRDRSPARLPKAKSHLKGADVFLEMHSGDPENSVRGLLARVMLLESQVAKLMKAEQARAREAKNGVA